MELMFITIGGCLLGLGVRYLFKRRELSGVILVPAFGAVVAAAVWVLLTLLKWPWDGGWIWLVTLVVSGLFSLGFNLLIGTRRSRADKDMFNKLAKNH